VPAIAVELPFTGFDDDVSVARRAIEEMGCASVVVGHSYGGAVISQAASRLPDVCHLVYVGAFVPDIGDDDAALLATHGSKLFDGLVVTDDGVAVDPDAARDDGVFPPEAQRVVATRVDEVVEWPTDHSPFITRPKEIADLVVSVLRRHAEVS
jgi:pimeloyl-ACP methyl ester carboxylesterase